MISRVRSALFSYFFCADDLSTTPTDLAQIAPAAAVYPPSLANARRRNFAQQELDSCWVLFFVDKGTYAYRGSGTLAYLHVWLNRRADYFTYLSPSLACRCKLEDVRPMRGVRLTHGVYFEGERGRTCCYYGTFVPWDVCSTRHPDLCFDAASLAGWRLFSSCRGQTSACSFFVSGKGRMSHFSGSYTLCSPPSLACRGEIEDFRHMRGVRLPLGSSFEGKIT